MSMSTFEEMGLVEVEPGLVEDTHENRQTIRISGKKYTRVTFQPDDEVEPVTLLALRDPEVEHRASYSQKKKALVDPRDPHSEYLSGEDLIDDLDAQEVTPHWVIAQTHKMLKEQAAGKKSSRGFPTRCVYLKQDQHRCWAWSPNRKGYEGYCNIHAKIMGKTLVEYDPKEQARRVLTQSAIAAAEQLVYLSEHAESEPVSLKATTEILDRVGIRGGTELDVNAEVTHVSPAEEVRSRLQELAKRLGASSPAALPQEREAAEEIIATVVEDTPAPEEQSPGE